MPDHRDAAVSPSLLVKAEGAGNDFLVGTGAWAERLAADPGLSARLCHRRRGLGADGTLALFAEPGTTSVRLEYRNADGSSAAFCANGTRCAARAAVELLGLPAELVVITGWRPIPARVRGARVTLRLPPPDDPPHPLHLEAAGRRWDGWFAMVGVPHLVLPVTDLDDLEVDRVAPPLRHHPELGPGGANVHFVQPAGHGTLAVRSFERGVEAETLACGSGVVAAALAWMAHRNLGRVSCLVRSGDRLEVEASGEPPACSTALAGPARLVAVVDPLPDLAG